MACFKEPDRTLPVRWRGSLDGLLHDNHLARFVWETLCLFDFGQLEAQYPAVKGGPGRPPYHPRLITALWIYAMTQGLETAAKITEACRIRQDFQWLAGGLYPCDQTLLNFITRTQDTLSSIWVQVLQAMQAAGFVDLSIVTEDGTKLRTNASPRSFHTIDKIRILITDLQKKLELRLKEVADKTEETIDCKDSVEIASLRARLARAQAAEEEVKIRIQRRDARRGDKSSGGEESGIRNKKTRRLFGSEDFRHDAVSDVLICPADKELRHIGYYKTPEQHSDYQLYGRRDCTDCALKDQCTTAKRRRVKIKQAKPKDNIVLPPAQDNVGINTTEGKIKCKKGEHDEESEPTASVTEPEAAWMRATSRKRWEPSFNADISVTKDGIIVSQFLTNDTTDYHHFAPALDFITRNVGKPKNWVGDGHYGTLENLALAEQEDIQLYAPKAGVSQNCNGSKETSGKSQSTETKKRKSNKFSGEDFRMHPTRDTLLCPADKELRFVGEYPTDNGIQTYRLYGRSNCTGCNIKMQCTNGVGRRVKLIGPTAKHMLTSNHARTKSISDGKEQNNSQTTDGEALVMSRYEKRMAELGNEMQKMRGHLSESVNAHLKQHGIGRFHIWRIKRCAVILTLACIAHNLMKWLTKHTAQYMGLSVAQSTATLELLRSPILPIVTDLIDISLAPNEVPIETVLESTGLSAFSVEMPTAQPP